MNVQKSITLIFFAVLLALTGCAQKAGPRAPEVFSQVPPTKSNPNRNAVTENIHRKLEVLDAKGLLAVGNFIDKLWETKATGGDKEVLVLTVAQKGFPPLLEEILARHEKLNTLPRKLDTLIILESKKVRGVKNIFIEVPAHLFGEKDTIFDWMPKENEWKKFIDARANRLEDRSTQEAFLTLFTMGNMEWNPEIINSVKAKNWDWEKMIHPGKTKSKKTLIIPIATLNPALKEFF